MDLTKVFVFNGQKEKLIGQKTIPPLKKKKYPSVILVHGFGVDKKKNMVYLMIF